MKTIAELRSQFSPSEWRRLQRDREFAAALRARDYVRAVALATCIRAEAAAAWTPAVTYQVRGRTVRITAAAAGASHSRENHRPIGSL